MIVICGELALQDLSGPPRLSVAWTHRVTQTVGNDESACGGSSRTDYEVNAAETAMSTRCEVDTRGLYSPCFTHS
jgi:hypothetical protein